MVFTKTIFLDSPNPIRFIALTLFNWFALSFLYSFCQELAKMQVRDAVIIIVIFYSDYHKVIIIK